MKREIPYNEEAEQSVIGAMLLSKYAMQKALEQLTKESFYIEKNGKIFEAIKKLSDKNIALDITTLTNELKDEKKLTEVGGVEYLTEILEQTPTASNIEYYLQIVLDKAIARRLIDKATEIATLGYETSLPINEVLEQAETKILEVAKNRSSSEFRTMPEVLESIHQNLEELSSKKGKISGIPTGLYDLDKLTDGFHKNELIIIAARPSMGKTALALNIATNVASQTKKTVAIFSLEMMAEQLVSRMISSLGQIEGDKLKNGNLQNQDWRRINEAISQLSDLNIYIDNSSSTTIGDIKAKCRRLATTDGNLGLIVIDYLSLISVGTSRYLGNRQQEVSEISRALKTLALELEIPVIALAQLSRTPEMREDKRPILSDLRESGSIEQDADIVAFIYRDDYYHPENKIDPNMSETEIIIRKNRSGRIGTAKVIFKHDTSSFMNYKKESKGSE